MSSPFENPHLHGIWLAIGHLLTIEKDSGSQELFHGAQKGFRKELRKDQAIEAAHSK
jgi:hypothetical protein